jgi:peptidoglycan hydrolase-like protein with peptidoglycan-binding domain
VIDQNGYASASMMPDLFEGMGTKAKPDGNVKVAQHWLNRHLGNRLVEDGVFGRNTRLAAIDFQKRSGLAPKDGTQAQLLARGYGAIKKATWEKLLTEPGVAV